MTDHRTGREEMWSASHPNVQIAWDATSLDAYMTCPRKYQLSIKEGWRLDGTSVDILFGLAFGDSAALYSTLRSDGPDHDTALRAAVRFALKRAKGGLREETGEELPSLDEADSISKSPGSKNTFALIRALVWWAEEYGKEPVFESTACEVSFRVPLGIKAPAVCSDCEGRGLYRKATCERCQGTGLAEGGDEYILCGHFDEVGYVCGEERVLERKTTRTTLGPYYFNNFHPNVQVDTYDLAARMLSGGFAGLFVEAIQTAKTFARFDRHEVRRTRPQAEEWLEEVRRWIKRAEQDALAGHWPMNTAACTLKGGCPFQRICSKDPGVRELYLKGSFKRLPWNPLRVR